ncbi:MAG TPA: hypothetical protein VHB48_19475, partial [Chitinophagaceae bacterium]|nr:hypothetical protein [Chitinophagaceae bacterium]
MNAVKRLMAITCLFFLVYTCPRNLYAETLLGRVITVDVKNKPLQTALEMISRKGEFYFSYNSSIVNSDSIVSITATDMKVGQILYRLFTQNYTFSETGNYIIIKKSPLHPAVVMRKAVTQNYSYTITGYISSDRTGEKLDKTSVYNKQALVSAITNNSGYFSLKVSTKLKLSAITISKEYYEDTTVAIQPGYNQQINIALIPVDTLAEITTISPVPLNLPADTLAHPVIIDSSKLIYTTHHIDSSWRQKTRLGQFFASAAQKIQGLNIGRFIAERPYQVSVTPGLGTHGKLSGQVVNDFSFNILGGYNAGVRVAELGLLFNINRFDVKHVQAGGLFNITGGTVTGVELAGIHN